MHAQLEILLQIQDLRAQRRDLTEVGEEEGAVSVEEAEFQVDPAEAVARLDEKIAEMEEDLEPPVRSRYRTLAKARGRAVVPVIGGTCYGCFTSIATATAYGQDANAVLRSCENCGRYVYVAAGH